MKRLRAAAIVLLVALAAIQFVPTSLNQGNITPASDFMLVNTVPGEVGQILKSSCYDCHSNHTNYPWYNKVQPVAWYLQRHIEAGKKELNFNEWGGYSPRRQKSKLQSMANQVEEGMMPLASYKLVHSAARLSDSQIRTLTEFLSKLKDSI